MRLFFIFAISLMMLTACGKKPNTLENVPGGYFPPYPAIEKAP